MRRLNSLAVLLPYVYRLQLLIGPPRHRTEPVIPMTSATASMNHEICIWHVTPTRVILPIVRALFPRRSIVPSCPRRPGVELGNCRGPCWREWGFAMCSLNCDDGRDCQKAPG